MNMSIKKRIFFDPWDEVLIDGSRATSGGVRDAVSRGIYVGDEVFVMVSTTDGGTQYTQEYGDRPAPRVVYEQLMDR